MEAYSTRAKRAACAKRLEDIATAKGATWRARHDGCSIYVTLERDGVSVGVSLDGESRTQSFLAHWGSKRRLCYSIAADIGGTVNPYHGLKATTFAGTFEDLLARIERGLDLVERGEAFADVEA